MLVVRWQAPSLPSVEQIKLIIAAEGMEPGEEVYPPQSKVEEHRHPFDEVRMVVSGEIFYNVSGNRLLLRPGDRITIPSNTRHSTNVEGSVPCISVVAKRTF
jgi:quercetin dioxygenase-like cupin family protein